MNTTALKLNERDVKVTRTVIGGILLASVFFVLYFAASIHFLSVERNRGEGYHDNDLYFQADSEFFTLKLVSNRGYYKRAMFHPLFPIMFNPFARFLHNYIDNPYILASLFCALFGAVCVLGSVYLFYSLGVPWPRNLLYASLVGISSSHLVFSTVPDTYIFSAAGLIGLMIIVNHRSPMWLWAIVSVYLIGVNIVNAVFVVIALLYIKSGRKSNWLPRFRNLFKKQKRKTLFRYAQFVALLTVALVVLQKLFLDFWLLSRPREFQSDIKFLFIPSTFSEAFSHAWDLVEHMLFFSLISPVAQIVHHERDVDLMLVSFRNSSLLDYSSIGLPGLIIWSFILLLTVWSVIRYRLHEFVIVKIALISILANAAIFYVYGDDMMLYSCEWTFFLILVVVVGIEKVILTTKNIQANLLITLFILLLVLNNLYFQWNLFNFHDFIN